MIAVAEQLDDETRITSVQLRSPSRPLEERSCHVCGATFRDRRGGGRPTCEKHRYARQVTDDKRAKLEEDPRTATFVDDHVGGASLYEIGLALGISKERVRQIESAALAKLQAAMQRRGVTAEDVRGMAIPFSQADQMSRSPRVHHNINHQRTRDLRAAELAALEEPSELVQRLTETLDEVIAVGELVSLAHRYASGDP